MYILYEKTYIVNMNKYDQKKRGGILDYVTGGGNGDDEKGARPSRDSTPSPPIPPIPPTPEVWAGPGPYRPPPYPYPTSSNPAAASSSSPAAASSSSRPANYPRPSFPSIATRHQPSPPSSSRTNSTGRLLETYRKSINMWQESRDNAVRRIEELRRQGGSNGAIAALENTKKTAEENIQRYEDRIKQLESGSSVKTGSNENSGNCGGGYWVLIIIVVLIIFIVFFIIYQFCHSNSGKKDKYSPLYELV